MSITIGKCAFDGPFTSTDLLEDRSGVYATICEKGNEFYLIDVGESATVKTRVETHDRKSCWMENCQGNLVFAVYYTPNLQQSGRMTVEQEIRGQYQGICCGKH